MIFGYTHIKEEERFKSIFKVLPLTRFLEVLSSNEFGYVKPEKWDDPFENFLLQQEVEIADGSILSLKKFTENTYGTCWTFNDNVDFSWRVYTAGHGVQIEVEIKELCDFLHEQRVDPKLRSFQIGKIQYYSWEEIKRKYESKTRLDLLEFNANLSLLTKRIEFEHEKEIRVILRYGEPEGRMIVKLPFDCNRLIKKITIDPRTSDEEFKNFCSIIKKLGYEGHIEKSQLYSIPKLKLKFNNIVNKETGTNTKE
jgi:hypothetical protein